MTEYVMPPYNRFQGIYGSHVVEQAMLGGNRLQVSVHGRDNRWFARIVTRQLLGT